MSVIEATAEFTIEDLLALPDHKNFELVDGQLVEVQESNLSNLVGTKVIVRLENYCQPHDLGPVLGPDTYFQFFPDRPRHARKPDASFILKSRLPADWLDQSYFRLAPDLAAEVVSPNDSGEEVEAKISEYLDAGVKLVWVVYPVTGHGVGRRDGAVCWARWAAMAAVR